MIRLFPDRDPALRLRVEIASDLGASMTRDSIDLPGVALTFAHGRIDREQAWQHACDAAGDDERPILAYSSGRRPWIFMFPLDVLNPDLPADQTATLEYPAALCALGNFMAAPAKGKQS